MTETEISFTTYYLLPLLGIVTGMSIWLIIRKVFGIGQSSYLHSSPVDLLKARDKDLRRLASRIGSGQSSALIGAFDNERSLLLDMLRDPKNQTALYGDQANNLVFSWVDISALDKDCTIAQFWETALTPLPEKLAKVDASLVELYNRCQQNQFNTVYLDTLLDQMRLKGLRLVLMLDRFNEILHCPYLDSLEFWGGLRKLASSRHPSPLVLVLSQHLSLTQFYEETQHLKNTASPFLNFLEAGEIILGSLEETEIDKLLQDGGFTNANECAFLKEQAGGHPYLLQLAATVLREMSDLGESNLVERATPEFYQRVKEIFNNILRTWSRTRREVFLKVLNGEVVAGTQSDLKDLEGQGFISKDKEGQWQARLRVFTKLIKEGETPLGSFTG